MALIREFPYDGVVTINRVILKPQYTVEDLEERVAELCEHVKTYHSVDGFIGGFVLMNAGMISKEGSTVEDKEVSPLKDREALIVTFWTSFEQHEKSHRNPEFQKLFDRVLELCENGNEEIAYTMLWQGKAYDEETAKKALEAKKRYAGCESC